MGPSVMGVDGCRAGWVAVEIEESGETQARTAVGFAELLDSHALVIGVDIPIGLNEREERTVDAIARRVVGARHSTVFNTPPRPVLTATSYEEANGLARELMGKGISKQTFALRYRILEVDVVAAVDERVIEVHPEVSFCELARRPLVHSKHKPDGLAERRSLLEAVGIRLPPRPNGVTEADLVDAGVVAWSAARFAQRKARALPEGHRQRIGAIWA